MLSALFVLTAGYLLGSLPFGVWIGRFVLGRDIRTGGSGHSGGTNTLRQAGWLAGVLVTILDLLKGVAAGWIAIRYGANDIAPVLAMSAAVAGHCWPILAGFRGGMGLATLGGVMLVAYPLGFPVGLALAIAGTLLLRHSARGNVAAGILLGPALWLLSGDVLIAALGFGGGLIVAIRSLSDWRRRYRELWLDRPNAPSA
jgi:acyl phosphate:glycerol-3-phosphate acyltransferase